MKKVNAVLVYNNENIFYKMLISGKVCAGVLSPVLGTKLDVR